VESSEVECTLRRLKILAIDTTSQFGSLALRIDGQTVAEQAVHSQDGYGHLIFPVIQTLIDIAGVRFAEIDCFAAAKGPGSFTGVRVALAAAKGLAEALGKPAAGISNLRALSSFGNLPVRAALADARRGDVYSAVYSSELTLLRPESVSKFPEWLESLDLPVDQFIFEAGSSGHQSALPGTRFEAGSVIEAPPHLAAAIAYCAELDGPARWTDPAALDASYVRRSDAEQFWTDERTSAPE